jgi:hypothetical protein
LESGLGILTIESIAIARAQLHARRGVMMVRVVMAASHGPILAVGVGIGKWGVIEDN